MCVLQEVGELKEEDLPSEDPSLTATSSDSTTLSESHTCTQVVTVVVLLYTGIADLDDINGALKNLVDWFPLGLELGLYYPTLKKIEKDYGKTDRCVMEMIAAWLQQQDNVSKKGVPSWAVLQTALREIGEIQLSDEIEVSLIIE